MSQYNFRLRFHLPEGNHINAEEEKLLVLEESAGASVRLYSGAPDSAIKDHSRASIIGGPYPSEVDAHSVAEQTKKALLIWAVRNHVGIDLGGSRPQSVITTVGRQWLGQQIDRPVRNDIHGIDVYEHVDNMAFAKWDFQTSVGKAATTFVEQIASLISTPLHLNTKQELAGEILSASYFDTSDRSRFITLITAVEALLDKKPRSDVAKNVVKKMMKIVAKSGVDEDTRSSMSTSLEKLKEESIGQAGRSLVDRLLQGRVYEAKSSAQFFTFCYKLRSSILHQGHVPDEIGDFYSVCNTAHLFVCDLLIASFAESG